MSKDTMLAFLLPYRAYGSMKSSIADMRHNVLNLTHSQTEHVLGVIGPTD